MIRQTDKNNLDSWLQRAVQLADRVDLPSRAQEVQVLREKLNSKEVYISFVGATSSGKSTIINNLLGKMILPVNPIPTTGAIVLIKIVDQTQPQVFFKVNNRTYEKDQILEPEFIQLAQKGFEDGFLSIDIPVNGALPEGSILIDVPGYNSLNADHDSIVSKWLPQMDIIYWVIDAKRGIAKGDKEFWDYATFGSDKDDSSNISLIVNCSNEKFLKRVPEIQKKAVEISEQISKTFKILYKKRINNHVVLDVSELKNEINQCMQKEERHIILLQRIIDLAHTWLIEVKTTIKSIKNQGEEEEKSFIKRISKRETHLKDQRNRATQLLSDCSQRLTQNAVIAVDKLKTDLWDGIENELDKATTIKSKEAITFIFHTKVREIIEDTYKNSVQNIEQETLQLSLDLENIWMDKLSSEWAPDMQTSSYDPNSSVDTIAVEKVTKGTITTVSLGYLGRMGGRAGRSGVVGVMNFTRKGLGTINKLGRFLGKEGSIFGRGAMNKVGPVLKRFGLTTVRVVEAFAFVATEMIMFTYKAATWRGKIRKKLKKILSEVPSEKGESRPVIEFKDGLGLLNHELTSCFSEECEIVYQRRLENLNAMKSRVTESEKNIKKEDAMNEILKMYAFRKEDDYA